MADVSQGQDKIWQAVDAIVGAGLWNDTVFLLTWHDWSGWDDHVTTPNVEHTPDGVQLAYGPRVPLLMFGGRVKPGIDSRWSSHVSIAKTALDMLGLPALGVPRLDDAISLADLVQPQPATHRHRRTAPTFSSRHAQNPSRRRPPHRRPPVTTSAPVGPIFLRDGSTLPPPNGQPIKLHQR